MLRVSKLADYATLLMTIFARTPRQLLSATMLAERSNLQAPTVSKLLKKLQKNGLLHAERGSNGGYRLARAANTISLADVLAAIEGAPGLTECSVAHGQCEQQARCAVRTNWQVINRVVLVALQNVSIADMARPLVYHPLLSQSTLLKSTTQRHSALAPGEENAG